jgi:epsilon-lactone hydrolase
MNDEKEATANGLIRAIRLIHGITNNKNDLEKDRQQREALGAILGRVKDIDIEPVSINGMEAEWVRPERKHNDKHVILYCHGGGYITGDMKYSRTLTTRLALVLNMDVLCFNYKLAPENPFPAALENAVSAWDYLMLLGYGSKDLFIVGDSAGGNLVLSLTLYLLQQKRKTPRGLVCMSPWTDMTLTGKSYSTRKEADPILDYDYISNARDSYLAGHNPKDPLVSPLFSDFTGFPPTYLQVGNNEILLSDTLALYKALKRAGVSTRLSLYRGMWHVFQMSPFKKATDALDEVADFIYAQIN